MLFRQTDAFVVDQAAVLDRVDARQDRVLDAFGAVSVRGDLAAAHVRRFRRCLEFLEGELRRARTVALREHAARGEDLDHVHAVLHLGANDVANLVHAVGDLEITLLGKHHHPGLRREVVQVAVAAGDRNARAAGHDSRADQIAFVDRIAQVDRQKRIGAHVANRGESGFQCLARIDHAGEGVVEGRVLEVDRSRCSGRRASPDGCGNRSGRAERSPGKDRSHWRRAES